MAAKQTSVDGVVIPVAQEAFASEVQEVTAKTNDNSQLFTAAEVEAIRKQEKDKLYKRIEDTDTRAKQLEEQLSTLMSEREAAMKEAEERAKAEHALLRQREVEELSAKELLLKREEEFNRRLTETEQQWQARLNEIEAQRQAQEALLEKERYITHLEQYRQRRVLEEQENIIPELIDLVAGNSEDEIELSINVLKERSSAIIDSIQQTTQQSQGRLRGAPVTAPPIGPMETQTEYQTLSAEDIRNMPMDQYVKMRDRLLQATRTPRGRF